MGALAAQPSYALDTEFHRERTYFPAPGLVQLAWPGGCALVDPLAVGLGPLAQVLAGPGRAVVHASSQDLELLQRACGTVPSSLFDTQLAAGFLGYSNPSLRLLAERTLGVRLEKASRLADWLRRPLSAEQLDYAAADVTHLLALAAALSRDLAAAGRLDWARQECEVLRSRGWGPQDPDSAWLRVRALRHLGGASRGVAQEVAAWRERKAVALDRPVRWVLPDLALVGVAGERPTSRRGLQAVRGLEARHLRDGTAGEILEAVKRGTSLPRDQIRSAPAEGGEADQRPAVALVVAWVAQFARRLGLDTALLATRADLTAFLRGDPEARVAQGWRAELLGRPLAALVGGELALALDGSGELVLERRSGAVVSPEDLGSGPGPGR